MFEASPALRSHLILAPATECKGASLSGLAIVSAWANALPCRVRCPRCQPVDITAVARPARAGYVRRYFRFRPTTVIRRSREQTSGTQEISG